MKLLSVMLMAIFLPLAALSITNFKMEVLTQQKDVIWGFDFPSKDDVLFSERSGTLKLFNLKTKVLTKITGVPQVWARGQGGLLDVHVDRVRRSRVFLTYSEPEKDGARTAVGVADFDGKQLKNFKKIFSSNVENNNEIHFGSRIVQTPEGYLFISLGDRNERDLAQDGNKHAGKIVRIKNDDSFKAEVWSSGHRNPQGLTYNPETKEIWEAEMGPRGGDELNLILKNQNYGWPSVTFGKEYWGPKIGVTEKAGFQQPVSYWVPSISPSAIHFYFGSAFPEWKGHLFMATLSGLHLRRLKIENGKVTEQEELLRDLGLRFRNVRTGPDDFIYFSTDDGKIARLVPSK